MTLENLTLPNLKEVGADLDLVKAEIVRRYELFPELAKALEDSIEALSAYIPKAAKGHKEGCFKYVAGGHDMWNCTCPICKARAILTRAKEIKI